LVREGILVRLSTFAFYAFWMAPIPVLIFLAVTMIRRNLRRDFPVFFTYAVFQIATCTLLFAFFHWSYKAYFCTYWLTNAAGVVLGFAVIREIFANLFRPYDALRDLGAVLFRWAAVVLVMVAVVTVASGATSKINALVSVIFALERSVRVMQCGLVLFMLLFSAHLGISSKHHVFGISLGFGVFAAVELMIVTLFALGTHETVGMNLLKAMTYTAATVIWSYYMLSPEPERITDNARAHSERWNMALANVRDPEYNFLPMVESVVERVLSQRHIDVDHHPEK
jgi:hypothetical protein